MQEQTIKRKILGAAQTAPHLYLLEADCWSPRLYKNLLTVFPLTPCKQLDTFSSLSGSSGSSCTSPVKREFVGEVASIQLKSDASPFVSVTDSTCSDCISLNLSQKS